jgi:hypothetical protein
LPGQARRYSHPQTQVQVELLVSGEVAGDGLRQQEIRLPDPAEAVFVEEVPVPSLARLIELKLATWDPDDRQDVAALIAAQRPDAALAEGLHPIVRGEYAECLRAGHGAAAH